MTEEKSDPRKILEEAAVSAAKAIEDTRSSAWRVHMQEMIRNDYVQIILSVGEWHFDLVGKADNIPEFRKFIISAIKSGFHVAQEEEEYEAGKNGNAAGYR